MTALSGTAAPEVDCRPEFWGLVYSALDQAGYRLYNMKIDVSVSVPAKAVAKLSPNIVHLHLLQPINCVNLAQLSTTS